MKDYQRLGDYIREVNVRNRELKVTKPMGININKHFMPSVANVIGTDLSVYKLVGNNQFACNLMHVGRDEKIPMAMHTGDTPIIVSPAYFVFEIVPAETVHAPSLHNDTELLPEYLMMWFRRAEFDRNAWFYTDADVRGGMNKDALLDMRLPIPSLARQREIVAEYETLSNRICLNEQMIEKLEATAQALYRKMFVDGIDKENLPEGWKTGTIGDLGDVVGGATPSTENPTLWCENGISWLSPADLSKQKTKFISKGTKDITELGYNSCSTKMLPKGSVLFSSRAPIGLMAITSKELCTNQGFKSIIPKEQIGLEYVYYYVLSIRDKIAEENTGSTFDEVSGQIMKAYSAIIPPTSITKEFSNLLEPVFNLQYNIEQENLKLTELQSLLLARMGK